MIASRPDQFQAPAALGAGDFTHLNGPLEQHFTSIHDLLKSWGAGEILCSAGLFHAVYETAGFDTTMVSLDRRSEIAAIIGVDAERIAYRYCSCDRSVVWPQIGVASPIIFHNRFTNERSAIPFRELLSFCELTCANEVEIAENDPGFILRAGTYLSGLFKDWRSFLSESAQQAAATVFAAPNK